jgi:hypothetical protein
LRSQGLAPSVLLTGSGGRRKIATTNAGSITATVAALELLYVLLGGLMLVLPPWFWVHCAKPMLRYRSAGPITTSLLFGVTVYTVVAEAVFVAATASGHTSQLLWFVAGLPWFVIVGLPYLDEYRTVVRLGRRR